VITAWIYNYYTEGFNPAYVNDAMQFVMGRLETAERVLLVPVQNVPDMIELSKTDEYVRRQIERDYGSLYAQERKMYSAFNSADESMHK
jgi:hypothetical protein